MNERGGTALAVVLVVALLGAVAGAIYFFTRDVKPAATDARITVVVARFGGGGGQVTVVVEAELEALAQMPPVGPHLEVLVRCDEAVEQVPGDMTLMGNASAGTRKTDSVEVFAQRPFAEEPTRCEIEARTSTSDNATYACLELGRSRQGRC